MILWFSGKEEEDREDVSRRFGCRHHPTDRGSESGGPSRQRSRDQSGRRRRTGHQNEGQGFRVGVNEGKIIYSFTYLPCGTFLKSLCGKELKV